MEKAIGGDNKKAGEEDIIPTRKRTTRMRKFSSDLHVFTSHII